MAGTIKKVSIVFRTEAGKSFTVSMNYAAPSLTEPEGAAKVQTFADLVLEKQPFAVILVSCEGAELTETTTTEIELSDGGGA